MTAKIGKNRGKLFNKGHWLARKPMKDSLHHWSLGKRTINGVTSLLAERDMLTGTANIETTDQVWLREWGSRNSCTLTVGM